MTGPPIPRQPPVAIGEFIIGVSPIGGLPAQFDYWNTVISQYANSPIITQLVQNMFDNLDPSANLNNFYDLLWNIDTAVGHGLDVWGRIIGVSRIVSVAVETDFWGFQEAGDAEPFNQGTFFSGTDLTENFILADDAYRVLLFAKALANITDGSIPAMNQLLLNLFPGRGNCYVVDNGDMTMVFQFSFALSSVEVAILNTGVLPKPAGVSATIVHL
jgi:hypothetical protein